MKDYIKYKNDKLDSVFEKIKKITPQLSVDTLGQIRKVSEAEKEKEINKEIIRRLRIQNKKLIEQVVKLKEEIKKTRFNRTQVLTQINELLKLINK